MIFDVTLKIRVTVRVTADGIDEAVDWAIGAAEHLSDTYNDEGLMDPLVAYEVKPAKEQS